MAGSRARPSLVVVLTDVIADVLTDVLVDVPVAVVAGPCLLATLAGDGNW